jgi:hypothetical protein
LEQQIATDERQWNIECEQYNEEKAEQERKEAAASAKEDQLRNERKKMVKDLLKDGLNPSDVAEMVGLVYD